MMMTNDEAATILYKEWQRFLENNLDYAGISDAYTMGINALKQELCDDCISRAEAEKLLRCGCAYEIWNLPSVQSTRPKIGHWIDTGSGQECSECGEIQYGYDNFRFYCAKCGSKNVIESEDKV